MLSRLLWLHSWSVFRRSSEIERADPIMILVLMFHRGSAVTYFIIMIWAIISVIFGIDSIKTIWGSPVQELYSGAVAFTAGLSWIGASYFPRFARYELFASSSLIGLMACYTVILLHLAITQGDMWAPLTAFSVITFVLPVTRVIFIYKTLVAEANRKRSH